jgi:hypothetical protein
MMVRPDDYADALYLLHDGLIRFEQVAGIEAPKAYIVQRGRRAVSNGIDVIETNQRSWRPVDPDDLYDAEATDAERDAFMAALAEQDAA